jgi:hypothetical protein
MKIFVEENQVLKFRALFVEFTFAIERATAIWIRLENLYQALFDPICGDTQRDAFPRAGWVFYEESVPVELAILAKSLE